MISFLLSANFLYSTGFSLSFSQHNLTSDRTYNNQYPWLQQKLITHIDQNFESEHLKHLHITWYTVILWHPFWEPLKKFLISNSNRNNCSWDSTMWTVILSVHKTQPPIWSKFYKVKESSDISWELSKS